MKRYLSLIGALVLLGAAGCTKTSRMREFDYHTSKVVTAFNSDGSVRKVYHSIGKVYSEEKSDGFYFIDAADGAVTTVSGFVEIKPVKTSTVQ